MKTHTRLLLAAITLAILPATTWGQMAIISSHTRATAVAQLEGGTRYTQNFLEEGAQTLNAEASDSLTGRSIASGADVTSSFSSTLISLQGSVFAEQDSTLQEREASAEVEIFGLMSVPADMAIRLSLSGIVVGNNQSQVVIQLTILIDGDHVINLNSTNGATVSQDVQLVAYQEYMYALTIRVSKADNSTGAGSYGTSATGTATITTVPEPSTWALLGFGVAIVLWQARRRLVAKV